MLLQRRDVVVEKQLTNVGRQVGLGVEEKRGDVVLQRALAAALVVEEAGAAIPEHDVAGLKVAVEEIVCAGSEEKFRKAPKIVFEGLFIEGNAGEAEEIVLEV